VADATLEGLSALDVGSPDRDLEVSSLGRRSWALAARGRAAVEHLMRGSTSPFKHRGQASLLLLLLLLLLPHAALAATLREQAPHPRRAHKTWGRALSSPFGSHVCTYSTGQGFPQRAPSVKYGAVSVASAPGWPAAQRGSGVRGLRGVGLEPRTSRLCYLVASPSFLGPCHLVLSRERRAVCPLLSSCHGAPLRLPFSPGPRLVDNPSRLGAHLHTHSLRFSSPSSKETGGLEDASSVQCR